MTFPLDLGIVHVHLYPNRLLHMAVQHEVMVHHGRSYHRLPEVKEYPISLGMYQYFLTIALFLERCLN